MNLLCKQVVCPHRYDDLDNCIDSSLGVLAIVNQRAMRRSSNLAMTAIG